MGCEGHRVSTHRAPELPEAETSKISLRKKIAKFVRSKLAERAKSMTQIDSESSVGQRVISKQSMLAGDNGFLRHEASLHLGQTTSLGANY